MSFRNPQQRISGIHCFSSNYTQQLDFRANGNNSLQHADLPAPLGDAEQCPVPAGAKPDESGSYIEAFSCQP